jgi:hypothetical protein
MNRAVHMCMERQNTESMLHAKCRDGYMWTVSSGTDKKYMWTAKKSG